MAELTITLDLSPADTADLLVGWSVDSDADLAARVYTLLARDRLPLLDAVSNLGWLEGWQDPDCPGCDAPCDTRADNEVYLGEVWHWRCSTDHAHDTVKSHLALVEVD